MRRFVVGTAGHVDHGKTTLVKALTGIDTDRLPEEKRRGITIELGFAPWKLADDLDVSIIDVPGHRRLVHTMIAGAAGIELVLLVVAGDEGVMPQTREHIAACELLGIRKAIVAITKMDRVGRELAELAGEEAQELLASKMDAQVICCSSKTGEGLDEVRAAVKAALLSLPPPEPPLRVRLSVDRAFSIKGAGTVVTGTLVEGMLREGTPLRLVGGTDVQTTAARGLHVHDVSVSEAQAPTRLAVNLASLSLDDFHRGDVLTDDESLRASKLVDVELRSDAPLKRGRVVHFYVGTARSAARIDRILRDLPPASDDEDVAVDHHRLVRLRLISPMPIVGGDRFVVRGSNIDGPSGAVLGGGRVLDAFAPRPKPTPIRTSLLEALQRGDAPTAVRSIVAEAAPRPVAREALASRFAIAHPALQKAADKLADRGEIIRTKGGAFASRSALEQLADDVRGWVAEHHQSHPLDRGMGLETLRNQLRTKAGDDGAAEVIRLAARTAKSDGTRVEGIVMDGDVVRLPSAAGKGPGAAVAGALGAAAKALELAGLKGVSEFGLKEASEANTKETRAIVAKLIRDGQVVHAGELWFWKGAVDELRRGIVTHLERSEKLTIADFKELSGLGRKQTIMLLEFFDKEGTTRRDGDDRIRGSSAAK